MAQKEIMDFISKMKNYTSWPRLEKALKMMKKQSHNLMVVEKDDEIYGVIKSQRKGSDLLYAVKMTSYGDFLCGTQNLRRCGGLKGYGPCKHLFLMAMALLANGSDSIKITDWFGKASQKKTYLGSYAKDKMKTIFEEYANVLTGEVEWREIETVPEDYIAMM